MVYLIEAIERATKESGTITFLAGDGEQRYSWARLYDDARRLAGRLRDHGLGPGRPLVVLALTSPAAITAALAGWLAGTSVTFAPTPARTMTPAGYTEATRRRLRALGEPVVLVGAPWTSVLDDLDGDGRVMLPLDQVLHAALNTPTRSWEPPAVAEWDPAILQMTSGTTDSPKIVRISHANVAANVEAINIATGHDPTHGRMLSWLPLSHDMGLIGSFVLPLSCGRCDVVLSSPVDYLAHPASWMEQISRYRATSTVGPNSAYALAAKLLATGPALDLSSLRCALSGGESVDPDLMAAFTTAAARHGFNPGAAVPAYGMAEATVAVTLSPLGRGLCCDTVDAEQLDQRGHAVPVTRPAVTSVDVAADTNGDGPRVRRMPLLGPPVAGLELRIVDPDSGQRLPDRRVGEVQIRGTSVTSGYHDDPLLTRELFTPDGWLRTGDLGYLADGELVITGRAKDVIILAGRNIYPDEVERAAARAPGVRAGNAVAFAYHRPGPLGGEGLAVAVETRSDDHAEIRTAVIRQIHETVGVKPHTVVVLRPGSIPKTPSGKLQRAEAARRFTP
ncbi:long-chain-fatty-acid--CoA ligase [Parafrankia discariae]|uniref:long-chain-fatty-acid--CoA ligase n=1 Tax=Parafrankia discariae TaxID=365528 RepID=UPI00036AEADA|nr:long-chain-fatty-acid--CoA ligase [Parafrankia discariae]